MSSALVVWFRPEHTFDVNLFFVSTHHTSLLMAAQLQRAQTASYFGWNETWVCAPGMQLKWAPAANGHLAHESRQARSQQENLGCTPVCSTNHFTLQPCSYLTCLSALLLHVNRTSGCSHLNHCNFVPPTNWIQPLGCNEHTGQLLYITGKTGTYHVFRPSITWIIHIYTIQKCVY